MMLMMQQHQQNHHHHPDSKPTVEIPQWDPSWPSSFGTDQFSDDESVDAVDAYACDEFRMYEFKIRRCVRGRAHDWTECPFAHPGEKARRRDPRKYHYSGTVCPDFRKGCCKRGDGCEFAHGVFECWLHPARYRTQPCKDGTSCRRRVCFFAHTPEQLRVLPQSPKAVLDSYDGSPLRHHKFLSISPPLSPTGESPPSASLTELISSIRNMQLTKVKSMSPSCSPPSWGGLNRVNGFCSLPTTPTKMNVHGCFTDEVAEERVESGRALRQKLYEKLSRDAAGPDVGWVSELVK